MDFKLIYQIDLEAVGPGCPNIELESNGTVTYRMEQDVLFADINCPPGFVFSDTAKSDKVVKCIDDFSTSASEWSDQVRPCIGKPWRSSNYFETPHTIETSHKRNVIVQKKPEKI